MNINSKFGVRMTLLAALLSQVSIATAQINIIQLPPIGTPAPTTPAPVASTSFSASYTLSLPVPATTAGSTCTLVSPTVATKAQTLSQTFVDNFDTFSLSTNKWTPNYDGGYDDASKTWLGYDWEVKRTQPAAHEQEIYVDPGYKGTGTLPLGLNPFSVTNSNLHIVAQRIPTELQPFLYNFAYSSGVLTTRRSLIQRYGYFEMRAKVPAGPALLPAFWMVPFDKSWPPELDIMEAPGHLPNVVETTIHWKTATGALASSGCVNTIPGFSKDFHLYGALWTPEKIVYYLDRKPIGQIATPATMNVPMYMIVNLAVGGDWVGQATATTPIPTDYVIDWVTAYTTGNPGSCGVLANGVKQCPIN